MVGKHLKLLALESVNFAALVLFLVILVIPWPSIFEGGVNLTNMLQAPSFSHPFGTDNLGRDLLVRINSALKDAVLPVWITAASSSVLGFCLGGFLAITNDKLRDTFRLILSIGVSVPVGLLVFFVAIASDAIQSITLLLPLSAIIFSRSIHFVLDRYECDRLLGYWEASRSIGHSEIYRVFYYGFTRNWLPGMAQVLSFHMKIAVICEVGISYLGFGFQEPKASFGNILASHFDSYLHGHFSVLIVVATALFFVTSFPERIIALCRFAVPKFHS